MMRASFGIRQWISPLSSPHVVSLVISASVGRFVPNRFGHGFQWSGTRAVRAQELSFPAGWFRGGGSKEGGSEQVGVFVL